MIRPLSLLLALGFFSGCASAQPKPAMARGQVVSSIESAHVAEPAGGASSRGADQPAVPVETRAPEYPSLETLDSAEAEVIVRYTVRADGRVASLSASGPQAFRAKAIEAVEEWRFRPATRSGQPVESRRATRFVFRVKV